MTLPETIRHYREKLGLSQEACARAADVSHVTWSRWELGKTTPAATLLPIIARVLKTTPGALLGEKTPKK